MKNVITILLVVVLLGAGFYFYQKQQSAKLNAEAVALFEQENYDEAIPLLEKAHARNSSNLVIAKNLGLAYHEVGEYAKARDIYKTLAERNPHDSEIVEDYDAIEEKAGLAERAAMRIERMRKEGWNDDDASLDITLETAESCRQMGDYKNAVILYERALFKNPKDIQIEYMIEQVEERIEQGIL